MINIDKFLLVLCIVFNLCCIGLNCFYVLSHNIDINFEDVKITLFIAFFNFVYATVTFIS